jgi:hypothetical protein
MRQARNPVRRLLEMPAMTFGRRRTAASRAFICWTFWKLVKNENLSACSDIWTQIAKINLQETEEHSNALKGTPDENYHDAHACKSFITPHGVRDQRWTAMLLLEFHPEGKHGDEESRETEKKYIGWLLYGVEVSRNDSEKMGISIYLRSTRETYAKAYESVPKHVLEMKSPTQSTL